MLTLLREKGMLGVQDVSTGNSGVDGTQAMCGLSLWFVCSCQNGENPSMIASKFDIGGNARG